MAIIQGNTKVAAAGGYSIQQSARFNRSDSAYLTRTFASDGGDTWTLSVWIKRGQITSGNNQYWFSEAGGSGIGFVASTDTLRLYNGSTIYNSTPVYRDTSAWYHIVFSNNSGTWVCYVNGETVSGFTGTAANFNRNNAWSIGQYQNGGGNYFDGYMADFYWVSGTAETADAFAETNADGVWVPKQYTGSYGSNGFHLKGQDSSALGDDSSGNGNNFTSSGLAAADQMPDTPTNNFCTWNPTEPSSKTNMSLQDGNLVANGFDSAQRGTIFVSSGKWYAELTISAAMSAYFGISEDTANMTGNPSLDNLDGYLYYSFNGQKIDQAGSGSAYGDTWRAAGKTVGVAVDMDNGAIWFSVDGVWQNSATISEIQNGTTTNAAFTGISGNFALVYSNGTAGLGTLNTGQSSFSYTQPTGFNAWSTANLPDPSIPNPSAYFGTLTWSGDSSNKNITGLDFTPDFLWIKQRNSAFSVGHQLYDVVRGAGSEKELDSSSTAAEGAGNPDVYGYPSAFVSGGFTATAGSSGDWDYVNKSGVTYVAWNWLADNTTGSSNTDGSITSTVSANTTSGFSIIEWSGTGANGTIGHGLGIQPSLYIVKNTATTNSWLVGSTLYDNTKFLILNSTAALDTSAAVWNSAYPTSSVINLGSNAGSNGSGTDNMICYAFAEIEGFSKFGSYTGNGSSDGVFVNTGFEVGFLMYKRTNAAESWEMYDSARGFNVRKFQLRANLSNAEQSDVRVDLLSNGFKARSSNTAINASGSTYIYMAFASSPFKTATAQ
jgi:hypothetical protein